MAGLPEEVRELFSGGNYAHLATVLPDGSPHSVPLWTIVEGGRTDAYIGAPFPMRSGVVFLVEVERAGSVTLPFGHR